MATTSVAKKPLLKLLMLHGYRQNEKSFRERTGGLRKSLRNHAEFVFCSAPHEVPPILAATSPDDEVSGDVGAAGGDDQCGWWFSSSDRSYHALDTTDCDCGFQESLAHINEVFRTQGPFDGVFAFSQGASLAAMLCKLASNSDGADNSLEEIRKKYDSIKFKFAILVAGFKSGQTQHRVFFDQNIKSSIPTLHVIGEIDKVIPCDMSTSLLDYFDKPSVFKHTGGHCVPVNAEAKNTYIEFFNKVSN